MAKSTLLCVVTGDTWLYKYPWYPDYPVSIILNGVSVGIIQTRQLQNRRKTKNDHQEQKRLWSSDAILTIDTVLIVKSTLHWTELDQRTKLGWEIATILVDISLLCPSFTLWPWINDEQIHLFFTRIVQTESMLRVSALRGIVGQTPYFMGTYCHTIIF